MFCHGSRHVGDIPHPAALSGCPPSGSRSLSGLSRFFCFWHVGLSTNTLGCRREYFPDKHVQRVHLIDDVFSVRLSRRVHSRCFLRQIAFGHCGGFTGGYPAPAVRLETMVFTLSIKSFQTPPTFGALAWPPKPSFRAATRHVTSSGKHAESTIWFTLSFNKRCTHPPRPSGWVTLIPRWLHLNVPDLQGQVRGHE